MEAATVKERYGNARELPAPRSIGIAECWLSSTESHICRILQEGLSLTGATAVRRYCTPRITMLG